MTSNKEKIFLQAIADEDAETVKKMLADDRSLAGQADEQGFTPLIRK